MNHKKIHHASVHKTCINILAAIHTYEIWIENLQFGLGRIHLFPKLQDKTRHNIDIYKRCIKRLEQRYNKHINQIKPL